MQPVPLRSRRLPTANRGATWPAIGAALALLLLVTPAHGFDLKLWPLIDYHSAVSGQRSLHLFGPLLSYEAGADSSELIVRPFFSFTRGVRQKEFTALYPLWISRWDGEQTYHHVLGLISYRSQDARRPDEWDRRFTIFPVVFYRYSRTLGTSLSVLPFYADVRDFLGYERVQMVAFPFYLHLKEPLVERTWAPFPFVGWTGGALGRGYRLWPFYGWDQQGEEERFHYIMWPFYLVHERHFTRPERERRVVSVPFYAQTDSPDVQSRSYVGPFFTHTIDRKAHTDTWGFPWPLWMSQRNLNTGQRTVLRLAPFYGDTQRGDVHAHFILWPAYRWSTQEVEGYQYRRSDVLLALYRDIEERQPAYHHQRRLRTLFPFFRASGTNDASALSSLALFDALYPRNPTINRVYAPLWQVFTREHEGDRAPRWSLLWDLVSSDGQAIRYPVHLDLSE